LGPNLGKGQQSFFIKNQIVFEKEEPFPKTQFLGPLCCLTQIMRLDLDNSSVYKKKEPVEFWWNQNLEIELIPYLVNREVNISFGITKKLFFQYRFFLLVKNITRE